jgi:hypothetical protein
MARKPRCLIDPSTNQPLPESVRYRGRGKYQARITVRGVARLKTFATAVEAARWRKALEVDAWFPRRRASAARGHPSQS